ncbi:MAG: hypothetical protein ACREV1_03545, partial [Gammaproteobacteria bacterium]
SPERLNPSLRSSNTMQVPHQLNLISLFEKLFSRGYLRIKPIPLSFPDYRMSASGSKGAAPRKRQTYLGSTTA